jgi:hypothetical protein
VEYLAKAIPNYCPEKQLILALSRHILDGEFWFNFVKASLCVHPRRIACNLFDEAILMQENLAQLAFTKDQLEQELQ